MVERGNPVLVAGFGIEDMERDTPVTDKTLFNLASVSKPVATLSIMRLYEEGRLALDAPLVNVYRDWGGDDRRKDKVTARLVLQHMAGLNMPSVPWVYEPITPPNPRRLLRAGYEDTPPLMITSEPTGAWNYSGGGYVLLQIVAEEITGSGFADHVMRDLFLPRRMPSTSFAPISVTGAGIATGYSGDGSPVQPYRIIGSAAGGLYSNARDMGRLLSCYRLSARCAVISKAVFREIVQNPVPIRVTGVDPSFFGGSVYGLGHGVHRSGNTTLLYHSGGNPGYVAYLIVDPNKGNGLVLMSNSESAQSLFRKLREIWADLYGYSLPAFF